MTVMDESNMLVMRPGSAITNDSINFFLNTSRSYKFGSVAFREVTKRTDANQLHQLRAKSVTFEPYNSAEFIKTVLVNSIGYLESLRISNGAFQNIAPAVITPIFVGIDWKSLTRLVIFVENAFTSVKHVQCCNGLLSSVNLSLPNIKCFELHLNISNSKSISKPGNSLKNLLGNIYAFLGNHCNSLTNLHFSIKTAGEFHFNHPEISANLKENLAKLQILEFSLKTSRVSDYGMTDLARSHISLLGEEFTDCLFLLGCSSSLKKFKFVVDIVGRRTKLAEIFLKHGFTLEEVEIYTAQLTHEDSSFDLPTLSFLKRCVNLTSIAIKGWPAVHNLARPTTVPRFPSLPKLRHVEFSHYYGTHPLLQMGELVQQHASTVESVKVVHLGYGPPIPQFNGWTNVKVLDVGKSWPHFFQVLAGGGVVFPSVTRFRTKMLRWRNGVQEQDSLEIINVQLSMIANMEKLLPIVEVINFNGLSTLPIQGLEKMKTMSQLRDVFFYDCPPALRQHCQTAAGIKLTQIKPSQMFQSSRQQRFWGDTNHFKITFDKPN